MNIEFWQLAVFGLLMYFSGALVESRLKAFSRPKKQKGDQDE